MENKGNREELAKLLLPFALTAGVIVLDQVVKALVVAFVPVGTVAASWLGDFVRIWHVRNLGVAFSMGAEWDVSARALAFQVLPIVLIAALVVYYFKTKELSAFQRWMVAGIAGGGLGNIIDRVFRPDGVVDFISMKVFGLFGWDRWPTYNIADMAVVCCGVMLFVTALLPSRSADTASGGTGASAEK